MSGEKTHARPSDPAPTGSELRMNEMEYGAAAHPHQMCIDAAIDAGAYRVWGVMDFLKRNRIPPEPKTIAGLLNVTERSVRRWISELHDARWLIWNKNVTDPWRRYELRQSNSNEEIILAHIRALFAAGQPSVEDIQRVIAHQRLDSGVSLDTDVQMDERCPN